MRGDGFAGPLVAGRASSAGTHDDLRRIVPRVTASKTVDGSRILFSEPDLTLLDDKEAYHVRNTFTGGNSSRLNYEYLGYSREIHGLREQENKVDGLIDSVLRLHAGSRESAMAAKANRLRYGLHG
jgi:hypothetical protein